MPKIHGVREMTNEESTILDYLEKQGILLGYFTMHEPFTLQIILEQAEESQVHFIQQQDNRI